MHGSMDRWTAREPFNRPTPLIKQRLLATTNPHAASRRRRPRRRRLALHPCHLRFASVRAGRQARCGENASARPARSAPALPPRRAGVLALPLQHLLPSLHRVKGDAPVWGCRFQLPAARQIARSAGTGRGFKRTVARAVINGAPTCQERQ